MSTITGTTINSGITLSTSGAYASPLTIASNGAVDASSGNAIYGDNTHAWTVVNQGLIAASAGNGILLDDGGAVINSGTILSPGISYAVKVVGGAGYLTNSLSGYIGSGGVGLYAGGTIVNDGRIVDTGGAGVYIMGGAGTVTNSGTILGSTYGVYLVSGGTVVDSGTISGAGGTAISFGGTVANRLVLDPGYDLGGVIGGGTSAGATNTLELGSAATAGTVSAALATEFANFGTVTVDVGAQWTLSGNSTLGAGVTLTDLGTLTNTGTIAASGVAVYGGSAATIDNAGTILSPNTGFTVQFNGDGSLTNSQNGYIGSGGVGFGAVGAVVNDGRIVDTDGDGVLILGAAGTVTNSGTILGITGITGVNFGIDLYAGGTVVNSGTISGAGGTAVYFGGAGANRLVFDPGYHLGGVVLGSTSAGATNTLELGSAATAGTVSAALDAEFLNFGAVTVDAGAQWTLSGNSTLGNGVTLTDFGTLTNMGTLSGAGYLAVDPATLVNRGSIGLTVNLSGGGYLYNATGSMLSTGDNTAVGGNGTVVNSGSILTSPTAFYTVYLGPGFLTNTQSGYIGSAGIRINTGGTVVNDGRIVSPDYAGIDFYGVVGAVTNSGTITGYYGINLDAGGTVVDSGTVDGSGGRAILFGGTGGNLLVLQNGNHLNGVVVGSSSATNTVELAGSVGAAVTASSTALGLANFQDLLFGAGGNDTFDVANTSGTPGLTISGFGGVGDIIDLTAIGTNGTIASQSSTEVTVTGSTGTVTLLLGSDNGANFGTVSDGASGTDLTACFRRGTLILTPDGEAAVEELAIGDTVVTLSGMARPIKWIGHRAYDPRFVAGNRAVLPIRVEAGVVADGVPARDLWVSPEHALHIDGLLVPARLLVNGITIRQVESFEQLEYFHIELDSHDVIFADGAPAESFGDTDNRFMFHNAAEFAALYPDGPPQGGEFCAPRVAEDSAELTAIRRALLERATALGRVTRDPGLHLVADGTIVHAASGRDGIYQFAVAAGTRRVALASRSAVPAEVYACSLDGRALGVPVERIELRDAGLRVEIGHNSAALGDGFHDDEAAYRWSDGRGCLPEGIFGCFAGDIAIEVHLAPSALIYPSDPPLPSANSAGPTPKVVARSLSADRPVAVAARRLPAGRSPTGEIPPDPGLIYQVEQDRVDNVRLPRAGGSMG